MLIHVPVKCSVGTRYLRNLYWLIRRLPVSCSLHSSARVLFPFHGKDLPTPTQLTSVEKLYNHDTDILLEQLRKAKSIYRILELVSMHLDVMNDKHIVNCFEMIHDVIRINDGVLEVKLCDDVTFQSLCSRLMDRVRYLDPHDIITVYKTLTKLSVPCNTYVMRAVLKMLCTQLNDLTLSQLTFVSFLLAKQKHNPIVDSLLLAVPLVLQVQIDQQLNSDNLQEAISCLRLACGSKLKAVTIEKIVTSLQNKVQDFTAEQACTVIFSLFSLDTPIDGYFQLIKASFEVLSGNINEPSSLSLLHLARLCVKQSFYYRSFFIRLCDRAVSENWDFDSSYELTIRMHRLNFFSPELIDLLAKNICSNADVVRENEKFILLGLSECLSFVDYQPANIHNVLDILSSRSDKLTLMCKECPHLFLKMVCCWAMLGYFPHDYVNQILSNHFLYSSWSFSSKSGRSQEFELYVSCLLWALEVYDQGDKYKIPAEFRKKFAQTVHQKNMKLSEFPLTKFLENGLGGSQFFLSKVLTNNIHVIDHVLALRTGNYPVALSQPVEKPLGGQEVCFVDEIHIPEDAKMLAILVVNADHYCTDPEILKGYMALKVKSLMKMSLCPVVINYKNWTSLPDREKIPFLMRQIKEAAETEVISDDVVILPSDGTNYDDQAIERVQK